MSEFIKFLKDDIFNGKKSFLATFITSWMIWNWQIIVVLFFDNSFSDIQKVGGKVPKILELIGRHSQSWTSLFMNELLMPLGLTAIRLTIVSILIDFFEEKFDEIKRSLDKNRLGYNVAIFIFPSFFFIILFYSGSMMVFDVKSFLDIQKMIELTDRQKMFFFGFFFVLMIIFVCLVSLEFRKWIKLIFSSNAPKIPEKD